MYKCMGILLHPKLSLSLGPLPYKPFTDVGKYCFKFFICVIHRYIQLSIYTVLVNNSTVIYKYNQPFQSKSPVGQVAQGHVGQVAMVVGGVCASEYQLSSEFTFSVPTVNSMEKGRNQKS